jgi:hypothetical protein
LNHTLSLFPGKANLLRLGCILLESTSSLRYQLRPFYRTKPISRPIRFSKICASPFAILRKLTISRPRKPFRRSRYLHLESVPLTAWKLLGSY